MGKQHTLALKNSELESTHLNNNVSAIERQNEMEIKIPARDALQKAGIATCKRFSSTKSHYQAHRIK